ncbi:MAG: prepilin-type N-terminal cleavage/methylation domain-containing protein [Candidatus Hydrogenedentota bacterium]
MRTTIAYGACRRRPHVQRLPLQAGFSLIELMIVMMVLGILAAAVMPVYGGSVKTMRLRSFQSDLVQFIGYVQERAVTDVQEYRIYVDEEKATYWVMRHAGWEDEEKVFARAKDDLGKVRAFPPALEVKLDNHWHKDRDRDAEYMTCYPNGSCDIVELTLREDGARRHRDDVDIATTGVMGNVEVDDYRDKRW